MKKIVVMFVVCLFITKAWAMPSIPLPPEQNIPYHTSHSCCETRVVAETALFVAVTALVFAVISTEISLQASQNSRGHVQIIRF